jgi:threonine dehydrogenase-like Zn-dependent dehydrogenase
MQDLEITSGYVPGYNHTLGHEFVGLVEQCSCQPELEGKRVVGEINCNDAGYTCADLIYQRNHAPDRWVPEPLG